MYTTVPRPETIDHRPNSGEPLPVIIDHNSDGNTARWKKRHRKEQLPYDTLKKHRDTLLEAEFKYKKTIRELEKEREELVNTYERAYQENKQLKSILEHGPDAAKLKQLSKDKKEQKGIIDQLQDENKALGDRLKQLEQLEKLTNPANDLLEKNWKERLDKVRKMREEEEAIPTQGPFTGGKLFKKKRVAIDDTSLEELDTYDLQLDTIQKETQVLLNKVKQLKREKEQIDYTLMMGKGAVTRNAVVANAISEKLNRDLNKYSIRLQRLKIKHKGAKRYVREVRTVVVLGNRVSKEDSLPPLETKNQEPEPTTGIITYRVKPGVKSPSTEVKPAWSISTKTSQSKDTKVPVPEGNNWIPPKHFDKPGTYSKLHRKSIQPIEQIEQEVPENDAPHVHNK
ncbi:uncharacterized protein LOC123562562 [Mercenaria mercenaria]|uniref:uncharacterized protein LOC123562562 n=1 Tax=Mercenaria mercenaria TaxID=6596 RepID=UPI00234F5275|nr:uncharacterized protein LOC123562562 [Mercenaria mercenaria]